MKIVTKCKGMFWQNTALSVDGKRYKAGTWFQLAPGRHRVHVNAKCGDVTRTIFVAPAAKRTIPISVDGRP